MRIARLLFFVGLIAAGAFVIWDNNRGPVEAAGAGTASAAPPSARGTLSTTFHQAVDILAIEPEDRRTYKRSFFGKGWADLDADCQDTRAEVLARESLVPVAKGCRVLGGTWLSYYDNKTWTRSFEVQIDHLVPLAEAWDSGAYAWDAGTRLRYANDLDDRRTLVPTTTALNYAKLADDPQRYVPKVDACRYISSWIAVKLRWNLTVDRREHDAIATVAMSCPDARIMVARAKVSP